LLLSKLGPSDGIVDFRSALVIIASQKPNLHALIRAVRLFLIRKSMVMVENVMPGLKRLLLPDRVHAVIGTSRAMVESTGVEKP
jgi:hypothetical protein